MYFYQFSTILISCAHQQVFTSLDFLLKKLFGSAARQTLEVTHSHDPASDAKMLTFSSVKTLASNLSR